LQVRGGFGLAFDFAIACQAAAVVLIVVFFYRTTAGRALCGLPR